MDIGGGAAFLGGARDRRRCVAGAGRYGVQRGLGGACAGGEVGGDHYS